MNKFFTGLLLLGSFSVFATDTNLAKVKQLASTYVNGKDITISVSKSNDGICGAEGPSYVATASIKKYERFLNEAGYVDLKAVPQEIATYGITAKELKKGLKTLIQAEQCLE